MKGVAPRLYSGNSRTVAIDAILNVTNNGPFKPVEDTEFFSRNGNHHLKVKVLSV